MYFNLTNSYIATKRYQEALNHIDTAIYYRNKYPHHDDLSTTSTSYTFKGNVFKKLGLMDSAIIYLTKGHEYQLRHLEEGKQKELIRIDKKYNTEKKIKELKTEKGKSNLLIVTLLLFIAFLLVLLFFYSKLHKANKLTQKTSKRTQKVRSTQIPLFLLMYHMNYAHRLHLF